MYTSSILVVASSFIIDFIAVLRTLGAAGKGGRRRSRDPLDERRYLQQGTMRMIARLKRIAGWLKSRKVELGLGVRVTVAPMGGDQYTASTA